MTEAEWLACTDLRQMLVYLRGEVEPPTREPDPRPRLLTRHGDLVAGDGQRVSPRRLGRFAENCCRRWWDLPLDEASQRLVASYERFLAGDGTWEDFLLACQHLSDAATAGERPLVNVMAFWWSLTPHGMATLAQNLAWATACHHHRERIEELERTATDDDRFAWGFFGYDFPEFTATTLGVFQPLPTLLREVTGNPFRTVAIDSAWLAWNHGTVPAVARRVYEDRAFHDLPILADALEDAGCTDADLLAHCRTGGGHVRGCWALDLLLGRA
jgi:hypothetical protein